jgi:uncharacterized RDD family membrane protein YckC
VSVDPQQHRGAPPPPGAPGYASWIRRAAAILLDTAVPFAVVLAVWVFLVPLLILVPSRIGRTVVLVVLGLVLLATGVFVHWNYCVRQGRTGQSLGKRVLGIRLVRARDGRPVGVALALARALLHGIDAMPLLLGYLRPLWHSRRQTFTDSLLDTVVVRAGP